MPYRMRAGWISTLCLLAGWGCATTPYHYGHRPQPHAPAAKDVVIEDGKPNKTLDRIAWFVGIPARILPLSAKVNRHELSPETTAKLTEYLERNDLADVHVYVNHYDPGGQWRRLRENTMVSPAWRYSVGVFSWLGYTILPNRVFGGDQYNPYTNSLYLNSDVPAVVLHEAAMAKNVHSRRFSGTYAAIHELPVISLFNHGRAVGDVLGYARAENDWQTEHDTYYVVYPRMGMECTAPAASFIAGWWSAPVLALGGAAAGHVAGRTLAARRDAEFGASHRPEHESSDSVVQAHHTEQADAEPSLFPLERLPKP
jgi:hypothetical protein